MTLTYKIGLGRLSVEREAGKKIYLKQVAKGLWTFPMVKRRVKTFPFITSQVERPQNNHLESLGMGAQVGQTVFS